MAIEGKTPAEVCGIEIKGKNKWISLIQKNYTSKNPSFQLGSRN